MVADVIYVPLYLYKGRNLTAILYAGFFALCVCGLIGWRASVARDAASIPAPSYEVPKAARA